MSKLRVIARIDVKNDFVIKGIHLEGLRKIGDPNEIAKKYFDQGIDEIVFMDAVAAYYDRNSLTEIIQKACRDVFVPITVGGGIRKIEDIQTALNAGADKIAINTKAVNNPKFISEASKIFGSQCIVSSIEAKKISEAKWEVYTDNGREPSGKDVVEWVKELEQLGAGEIMITSIDNEGTKRGFDIDLNRLVAKSVNIPVISSGGAGSSNDIINLVQNTNVSAVALASLIHYEIESIENVKKNIINKTKINVRI